MGCYEVSLGDTIGVGTPGKVETPNYMETGRFAYTSICLHRGRLAYMILFQQYLVVSPEGRFAQ